MRKLDAEYGKFRLSKINDAQFSHLKLLFCWVVYFIMYILTENIISADNCHIIHSKIDDIIPFCEVFVVPYVLWYVFIAGSLFYYLLYNVDSFKRLQIYIFILQMLAMIVYIVYPSRQDLRPEVLPRSNFFTHIIGGIYAIDTDTGVCPSLHVAISAAIASSWVKEKTVSAPFKVSAVVFAIIICLSTMFIKQHSIIDSFAAIPICLIGECAVYGKSYWLPKLRKVKHKE